MDRLYALSVRQPWAELIMSGKKTMELRSWATDYRGLLFIHTGLKSDLDVEHDFGLVSLFKGGYLGTVVLGAVVLLDEDDWEYYRPKHLELGNYQPGCYGWFLESPRRFAAPISGPGQLGLYFPPKDLDVLLQKAICQQES